MAKTKPKVIDQGTAMERILGFKKPELENLQLEVPGVAADKDTRLEGVECSEKKVGTDYANTINTKNDSPKPAVEETFKKQKVKYIQTAFYITQEQHKALKLRAIQSDDPNEKDMSAVVRAAINTYLNI